MTPNLYFGSANHASAVLKRDAHRVRAIRPQFFRSDAATRTQMDEQGRVTTQVSAKATVLSPRSRHELAHRTREPYKF